MRYDLPDGTTRCLSTLHTTVDGRPFWPSCDLAEGHEGPHRRGHWQDEMWSWTDEDAWPNRPAPGLRRPR